MALAFDIETIPQDVFDLDPEIVTYLTGLDERRAARGQPAESELDRLGLSPFTCRVASIAMFDTDKERGCVAVAAKLPALISPIDPRFRIVETNGEAEVLSLFWRTCAVSSKWITFNGRSFDVPITALRSAVHGLSTCAGLVESNRYHGPHVDIKDRAEGFGAMWGTPYNFDVLCRALGVKSPKSGMDGGDVARAWHEGRIGDVAAYNVADVVALVDCAYKLDDALHLGIRRKS